MKRPPCLRSTIRRTSRPAIVKRDEVVAVAGRAPRHVAGFVKRATRRSLTIRRPWETWKTSIFTAPARRRVKRSRTRRPCGVADTERKPASPVQSPDAAPPALAANGQPASLTL